MSLYVMRCHDTIIMKGRDTMTKNLNPPKNSAEAEKRINAYFASRTSVAVDKNGNPILDDTGKVQMKVTLPYTLTGLALALGLETREELFEFEDEKIKRLVKKAVLKVEEYAEERLFSKEAFSGVKLFLSVNFERWKDSADGSDDEYVLPEEVEKWTV